MEVLALRLVLPPLLVTLATITQRRLGDRAGGLLVGLPLTSGTYLLLLVPTHGADVAAEAATGVLAGQVGVVVLCVAYAWTAARARVAGTLGAALLAWAGAAASARWLAHPALVVGLFAVLAAAALLTWPADRPSDPRGSSERVRRGELVVRASLAAGVVVLLSAATGPLGPRLGGLLAAAPLVVLVVAPATHRGGGPAAVRALLHGVLRGSVVACLATVALLVGLGAGR